MNKIFKEKLNKNFIFKFMKNDIIIIQKIKKLKFILKVYFIHYLNQTSLLCFFNFNASHILLFNSCSLKISCFCYKNFQLQILDMQGNGKMKISCYQHVFFLIHIFTFYPSYFFVFVFVIL